MEAGERRGLPSPFRRLLLTDYYDGPTAGIAVEATGELYLFRMLDWDDQQRRRVYSFGVVPGLTAVDADMALGAREPGDPAEWVLPVELHKEGEALLKKCETTATAVAVVVAEDLLGTLDLWSPAGLHSGALEPGEWLERLGFPRRRSSDEGGTGSPGEPSRGAGAEDDARRIALLRLASGGTLDGLPCPTCGESKVCVRFTNPASGEYRTWFLCCACDFRMRAQNSGKPPHFRADRIDPGLEQSDRD